MDPPIYYSVIKRLKFPSLNLKILNISIIKFLAFAVHHECILMRRFPRMDHLVALLYFIFCWIMQHVYYILYGYTPPESGPFYEVDNDLFSIVTHQTNKIYIPVLTEPERERERVYNEGIPNSVDKIVIKWPGLYSGIGTQYKNLYWMPRNIKSIQLNIDFINDFFESSCLINKRSSCLRNDQPNMQYTSILPDGVETVKLYDHYNHMAFFEMDTFYNVDLISIFRPCGISVFPKSVKNIKIKIRSAELYDRICHILCDPMEYPENIESVQLKWGKHYVNTTDMDRIRSVQTIRKYIPIPIADEMICHI